PDQGPSPLAQMAPAVDRKCWRLAGRYAAGAVVLAALGLWIAGAALWLLWPALSLALVAAIHAVLGAGGFQQGPDGRMSLAARGLLAPWLLASGRAATIDEAVAALRRVRPRVVLDAAARAAIVAAAARGPQA